MLISHDEIDKCNWLVKQLVITEHGLLKELSLPLGKPGSQLFILVVV